MLRAALLHSMLLRCWACSGVFVSSWLGGLLLQVGEWIIKKLPLVKHIYSAAKQVSVSADLNIYVLLKFSVAKWSLFRHAHGPTRS